MKKILIILFAALGLFSCKKTPESVSVPYETAQNYFAYVDVSSPTTRKLMDLASFESMFDYAWTMGSEETPLDFDKEFVIAVVHPSTYDRTTLAPVSLVKENGSLIFTYSEKIGEKQSSSRRPFLIVRVARQYDAPLQVIKVQN